MARRDRFPTLPWLALPGIVLVVGLAAGLPSPTVHGPLHYLGVMGPVCGATRGVTAFARGDMALAWAYNPASLALLPGAVVVLARWALGRVTGRWLDVDITPSRSLLLSVAVTLVAVTLVALTVRQQGNPLLG